MALPGLIEAAVRRRRGEPYPVALTFDDDLGEHLEHAAPLLAAEGLPATFFLCGRDLLGDGEFWWETLQRAADAGASISELPPTAATGPGPASSAAGLRARAASIEVLPPGERDAATAKLIALAGERTPERRLGERQIAELTRRGHSVGFHTRRHQLLTGLDDDALRSALNDGREQLARATGTPIEMIAYPHGRVDQRVADVAREEGFATGFATGGAGITPDSDPLRLDRLPADELSVSELAAAIPAAIARARSR